MNPQCRGENLKAEDPYSNPGFLHLRSGMDLPIQKDFLVVAQHDIISTGQKTDG